MFESIVSKDWHFSTVLFNCKYYFYWLAGWVTTKMFNIQAILTLWKIIFIIKKDWWWRPSLRNYILKQINYNWKVFIFINKLYTVYVCMFICTKQRTTSLFSFMIQHLCYSRQNKNFSIEFLKAYFHQKSNRLKPFSMINDIFQLI